MLYDWNNFYYLIGSAAAGLIGLLFVVVTLTAGFERSQAMHGSSFYMTPTVVNFAVVLSISAAALAPGLSTSTTAILFGLVALVGLAAATRACVGIGRPREGMPPYNYQFVYITRGAGVFESVAGGNLSVRAGDLLVLFPHVWHRYKPVLEIGWDEYWLEFDGDSIRRLIEREEFTPQNPVKHIGVEDKLLDLFLESLELLRQESPKYQILLGTLAMHLVAHVISVLNRRTYEQRSVAEVIREAKRWLTRNPLEQENLDNLAARLNMSYSSFRRLFKSETGFSPHQFVLEVRLSKACDL